MTEPLPPPPTRQQSLARLDGGAVDVLVVGGGIVGAGVARDAAMRGLSVALVEQDDFAAGTSSRSSRLLHGGLRYLAQGRLRLVREALREKMVLGRIAPHLVRPLPFVFPTYRGSRDWVLWKLRIGVKLYDRLGGKRNFAPSRGLRPEEVERLVPGISTAGLTGAVRYFDAATGDARLVLDTLRSAAAAGACVVNYAEVESAEFSGGAWRCRVLDSEGGGRTTVSARAIVNAAGAWADRLPASRVKLRLTKGSHVVVRRERLPVTEAVVMTEGRRILFAIPWGERTILGTTDTDYAGDLRAPVCTAEDARYILGIVNRTFPTADLTESDVTSAWAGLRPLVASGPQRAGKPSEVSREHDIHMTEPGWFDVAGGKLTTYRLMAEQAVDKVVRFLGTQNARPCVTAGEPLLAAPSPFSGVVPPEPSREAVEHYCRDEWAHHLDDVMVRRSDWQHYRDDAPEVARRALGWMAAIHGWTDERTEAEWQRYLDAASAYVITTEERTHEPVPSRAAGGVAG